MVSKDNFSEMQEALSAVQNLCTPSSEDNIHIWWPFEDSSTGIGLDSDGRYFIIFSSGSKIEDSALSKIQMKIIEPLVRTEAVWYTLYIPQFDQAPETAGFLYSELRKNGLSEDPEGALLACYELVLALTETTTTSRSVVIGLIGELLVLKNIGRSIGQARTLDSWYGYKQSNRDMNLDGCGIEIKTTLLPQSLHTISSVKQVSPGFADTTSHERRLYLVSVGLRPTTSDTDGAFSLLSLIRDIMDGLAGEDVAARFAANVLKYLGHEFMSIEQFRKIVDGIDEATQTYHLQFIRTYDLLDDRVEILRIQDTAAFSMILGATVTYKVHLPNMIDIDNPASGLEESMKKLLGT